MMELTPTQAIASECRQASAPAPEVHARLLFLHIPGAIHEICTEQRSVCIGRHPDCDIVVEHKCVSSKHIYIFGDEENRYFLEECGVNGCWLNKQHMKKGETRALHHGDDISVCVRWDDDALSPFAAYIFLIANGTSAFHPGCKTGGRVPLRAELHSQHTSGTATLVSERWVHECWDMLANSTVQK